MQTRLKIGLPLISIGGFLLAVVGRKTEVQSLLGIGVPDGLVPLGLIVGIIGLFIIVTIAFLPVQSAAAAAVQLSIHLTKSRKALFECSLARRVELPKIHKFSVQHFGLDTASLSRLQSWYDKNDQLFRAVYELRDDNGEPTMIGCFRIVPLSSKAAKRVEHGAITGGDSITADDIAAPSKKPSAVYIGGLASVASSTAKGVVLAYLKELVEKERTRGVTAIYARGVTRRGMQLIKRNGFVPVNAQKTGLGHMYRLPAGPADHVAARASDSPT